VKPEKPTVNKLHVLNLSCQLALATFGCLAVQKLLLLHARSRDNLLLLRRSQSTPRGNLRTNLQHLDLTVQEFNQFLCVFVGISHRVLLPLLYQQHD
jgi:hypothetical protein